MSLLQCALEKVVLASLIALSVGFVSACGDDFRRCPAEVRYAAIVEVRGAVDFVVEERITGDSFFECSTSTSSSPRLAYCGGDFVGTFEIRATAADGRVVSTTVNTRRRSDECGPIVQEIVLDFDS